MAVPDTLTTTLEDGTVSIRVGGSTTTIELRLSVEEALPLSARLLDLVKDERESPEGSILSQPPFGWFHEPNLEIGADENGQLLIAFQTSSLPPIFYSLHEETVHD